MRRAPTRHPDEVQFSIRLYVASHMQNSPQHNKSEITCIRGVNYYWERHVRCVYNICCWCSVFCNKLNNHSAKSFSLTNSFHYNYMWTAASKSSLNLHFRVRFIYMASFTTPSYIIFDAAFEMCDFRLTLFNEWWWNIIYRFSSVAQASNMVLIKFR